jgi:LmbE family N-acetylglucosaminyl deacetylase
MHFQRILAISPHTDDIELSCGATLAKFASENCDIYYIALSDCQDTLINTQFKNDTLSNECKSALKILGVKKQNIFINHFTNKLFFSESRKIFETLDALKTKIKPDLIFIPDLEETHQDHNTVAHQALTVFRRNTSILCYEQPWNNISFSPNFFVSVTEKQMTLKMNAIKIYKTQLSFNRSYLSEEFIRGLARTRGIQINEKYAEGFKIIKLIA